MSKLGSAYRSWCRLSISFVLVIFSFGAPAVANDFEIHPFGISKIKTKLIILKKF
jgi:hypothetical protein